MKETSGEFSMTVVVIIGAIILVGILTALKDPLTEFIRDKWMDMVDEEDVRNRG